VPFSHRFRRITRSPSRPIRPGALWSYAYQRPDRIRTSATRGRSLSTTIYRSTDKVPGGDVLLLSSSQAPLAPSAFADLAAADGDLWPAAGQFCYLIATISAADDSTLSNNTIVSHPIAVANFRYVEVAGDNSDIGPTPPAFNDTKVSVTGLTLPLNGTIALEGTMDPWTTAPSAADWDTYKFTTGAGVGGISMKARWDTGFDDIDMYLWNTGTGEVKSLGTDLDSEPGRPQPEHRGIAAWPITMPA
jgi:hypothetical protein